MLMFQEKELQNFMYRTIFIYTVSTVNHKTAVPAVWKIMRFFTMFSAFLPSGSSLGVYRDTDRKSGKFPLKPLVSGSVLGSVTQASSAPCMAAEVV